MLIALMKNTLAVFALAIAACGGGGDNQDSSASAGQTAMSFPCGDVRNSATNNHGCGFEFDAQGPQGLKLRYETTDFPIDAPGDPRFANPATYEAWFDELRQCLGLNAPMLPFVIILPEGSLPPTRYQYFSAPFLVVLDTVSSRVSAVGHKQRFNHAATHYLLEQTTGSPAGINSPDQNFPQGFTPPDQDHLSTLLFGACVNVHTI